LAVPCPCLQGKSVDSHSCCGVSAREGRPGYQRYCGCEGDGGAGECCPLHATPSPFLVQSVAAQSVTLVTHSLLWFLFVSICLLVFVSVSVVCRFGDPCTPLCVPQCPLVDLIPAPSPFPPSHGAGCPCTPTGGFSTQARCCCCTRAVSLPHRCCTRIAGRCTLPGGRTCHFARTSTCPGPCSGQPTTRACGGACRR
jgi:hypothetical protein